MCEGGYDVTVAKLNKIKNSFNLTTAKLILFPYLLLLAFSVSLSTNGSELPKLNIVTENLVPYQILNTNGHLTGLSVEIVQEMLQRLAVTPNIKVMPWARAYEIAKNEANVLIFSIAHTPHRADLFHWIGCITDEKFSFWGLRKYYGNSSYSMAQLKAHKIAVSRYSNAEQFVLDKEFSNILRLIQEDQNIQMLFNSRADLIVATELTVKHRAKKLGYDYQQLVKVRNANELNNKLCIALSLKSEPQWAQRLRFAYQQLEQDGVIYKLRHKWLSDQ